ncbi:MAG: DNA-processing protein DprA [Lentisphaeria bacterium]|nr:DNA-processing protein DprA [Lentisphaeria bacterium]
MTEQEGYIILNMLNGIGPARLNILKSRFGSPVNILQAGAKDLAALPGIGSTLAEKIANWEKSVDLDAELLLAEKGGVKIVTMEDEDYPIVLRELRDAPLCLYVRGVLPPNIGERSLGIVGTRSMSHYGSRMAKHLSEAAAYSRFTVISGLAYGVDACAHRAVLDAGGRTVSVLGGGLARIQPQDHVPLAREIVEKGGAVISEFPMTTNPTRHTFPLRNRIISGLSTGVLVVEAGLNSGSLITANFALEQNKTLFAVPGHADDPGAAGCNSLIRQGAVLVESFDHILEEFEFLPTFTSGRNMIREERSPYGNKNETAKENTILPDTGDEESNKILAILQKEKSASLEILAEKSNLPASTLSSLLIMLELEHRIVRLDSGLYRLKI